MTELADHAARVRELQRPSPRRGRPRNFFAPSGPRSRRPERGINVAQMAGMPTQVVDRAKDILARLEKEQIDTEDIHDKKPHGVPANQQCQSRK